MPTATPEIDRLLRAFRRRLVFQDFLNTSVRASLFFLGVLVVLRGFAWWYQAVPEPSIFSALSFGVIWAMVVGAISGLLITLVRCPSLRLVAERIDALGGTRDRVLTTLEFAGRTRGAEMEQLAVQESRAWLKSKDFRPLAPVHVPGQVGWLAVPIAMLGMLWWLSMTAFNAQAAALAAAQEAVKDTTQKLEKLANELEKRAAATDDETLKRVAERLKQGALQVRVDAEEGKDPSKAALRELAELEQIVKDLRRPQEATPAELKALADALAKHETTKDAAKAIEQSNFAEAAKQLEKALKEPGAEEAQKSLAQALEHLARKKEELSKQLEKLAQQGGGNDAERQQLLQELSQLLNEMAQQQQQRKAQANKGPQKQKGEQKPMTNEDLKKLLSALQQMKDRQQGEGDGDGEEGEPQDGEGDEAGDGAISMLSFREGKPGDDPGNSLDMPSGKPGSERDEGTTPQPYGKNDGALSEAERQEQSKGKLGAGESLSALVPSAANGDAKATRRYKELTDAAAAAAEDTVTQENIPLGSRFLIRRYFEAIRPK